MNMTPDGKAACDIELGAFGTPNIVDVGGDFDIQVPDEDQMEGMYVSEPH